MELSSQEGDIPIPLNSSTFGGGHGHGHGHMIHHDHHPAAAAAAAAAAPHNNHIIPSNSTPAPPLQILNSTTVPTNHHLDHDVPVPYKKVIRYRECLKNHAAAMGGNATDGCGEFMPSGEEGTIEALNCSACNCHRNFHRKEIEGEPSSYDCYPLSRVGRKVILGHHHHHHKGLLPPPEALGYPTATGTLIHSRSAAAPTPHHMIMSYNMGGGSLPSESDEHGEDIGLMGSCRPPHRLMKKRFRTKFSQEQKEKMLNFAEKVGWKIQKQEESVVQQFCQEIGVKRRVLKVWMHNNKHNLAKKSTTIINNNNNNNNVTTATTTTPAA